MAAIAISPIPAVWASFTPTSGNRRATMESIETGGSGPTMDTAAKANAFREVLKKMGAGEKIDPGLWGQFVAAQNDDLKTGSKAGEKIPDFTLPDHTGKQWSLHDLMGPRGLLLVFVRSADW
jgi:hypothetical protein